jgi:hypothetical protein
MITIDPDKSKVLEFKVNISGNAAQPSARLIMPLGENLNLSIPGQVHNGSIQVVIPKLKPFYEILKSGAAQLEVIVDDTVYKPWIDQIEYKEQIKVVAEIVEEEKENISSLKKVQVGASLVTENEEPKKISPTEKEKDYKFKINNRDDYL